MNKEYEKLKEFMYNGGYTNILKFINQDSELSKTEENECCGKILKIKVPYESAITISTEPSFILDITDKNGNKIPDNTELVIWKHRTSENVTTLGKIQYSNIKNGYRFVEPLLIAYDTHLCLHIVNYNLNISKENIRFNLLVDYWTKD